MGNVCARRRPDSVKVATGEHTPFWEHPLAKEEPEEEEQADAKGIETATHLKDEGKEKFVEGKLEQAIERWNRALDVCLESGQDADGSGMSVATALTAAMSQGNDPVSTVARLAAGKPLKGGTSAESPEMTELRLTLMLNLALAHRKLRQWREAIVFCDFVLNERPDSIKALYRKADAFGELGRHDAAEDVLKKMEALEDTDGKKQAQNLREEWRKKAKEAESRQKKMWSAAIEKRGAGEEKAEVGEKTTALDTENGGKWMQPRLQRMSVFDLRKKGIHWKEEEDFVDSLWLQGLGLTNVEIYQKSAFPLTLLAAAALAELALPADCVVHCILDGNMAPFAKPHNWGLLLERCSHVQTLTVIYIDIGSVDSKAHKPPMPYGVLLRPEIEGRVGDRVARAARFLGTYAEFCQHARDLPGLVRPHVALWADVPLYGYGDSDFAARVATLKAISEAGVMSVITQSGEVQEPGAPPISLRLDAHTNLTVAALSAGLHATMAVEWLWNRFVVPLDRGERGVLAAHAILGVVRSLPKGTLGATDIKRHLEDKGVTVAPYTFPKLLRNDGHEALRQKQWQAFVEKLRSEGRDFNPEASEAERRQRMREFYEYCGASQGASQPQ
mmetsp:Transcript_43667/g.100767  ORF Transcript_43667/g.100767 Transcript_43667/m.100767 type:complete len:616 (-) Transcript_43667:76-1923(-)